MRLIVIRNGSKILLRRRIACLFFLYIMSTFKTQSPFRRIELPRSKRSLARKLFLLPDTIFLKRETLGGTRSLLRKSRIV